MRLSFALVLCVISVGASAQDGQLIVESEPPGATIVVDDNTILGQTTPGVVTVTPGLHRVRLRRSGFAAYQDTITVRAGESATLTAQLQREFGQLSFANMPAGASIRVNGEPFDPSVRLPLGSVSVEVDTPADGTVHGRVPIVSDQETVVSYAARQFRGGRIAQAFVAPGLVQMRNGRAGRGRLFAGAFLGGLVTAGAMTVRSVIAVGDTTEARERYDMADNEADAVAARENLLGRVGAIRSSRQIRGAALATVGIVYAVSLIDTFARHVRAPSLVPSLRNVQSFGLRASEGGASLTFSF